MEKEKIDITLLRCDQEHIIHRVGSPDYPTIRKASVRSDDAANWEVVPLSYALAADVRNRRLAEVDAYDTSPAVNGFAIDGTDMWLDKATRVGLVNSVNATAMTGGTSITLWYGTRSFVLPLDAARAMLAALEVYALECFNTTACHRAALTDLTDPEALEAYDITAGYPPKPQFSTTAQ